MRQCHEHVLRIAPVIGVKLQRRYGRHDVWPIEAEGEAVDGRVTAVTTKLSSEVEVEAARVV